MKSSIEVIKKLKELLEIKTDFQLAKLLDVKPNTVSSWKSRESLHFEKIIALCEIHKIDLNTLFLEGSENINGFNLHKRRVKMISVEHHFEYCLDAKNALAICPTFIFPTEEEIDTAFQISSENMYPTIKVTSYVLSEKISLQDLKPWNVYVLVLKDKGIVCYRFKRKTDTNELFFISDNENYENLIVPENQVKEVFCVRGAFIGNNKNMS
ncbi:MULTISPECIES: helix-turn-helix domain-containing protein [Myroides]|uniref:helix-turn-helix domain-containing protein n=1 Tax=Myroides TaxID=76831 RepID=UPI00130382AA|nr:helix-turn-helix domain-containing protein [Myroides phaeus]